MKTENNTQSIFSQSLWFPPGWWVQAYTKNASLYNENLTSEPNKSAIWPPYDNKELSLFLTIFMSIQNEILSRDAYSSSVSLDLATLAKSLNLNSPHSQKLFERLFFGLSQVKIVDYGVPRLENKRYSISGIPLFEEDQITADGEGNTHLQLKLSSQSLELLSGTCDIFGELLRVHKRQSELSSLCSRPLFGLWRSAWLDTKGLESDYLILLEKALNWQQGRLSFEGHIVAEIDEFLKCFSSQKKAPRHPGIEGTVLDFHKTLSRFFRKLVSHGYLVSQGAESLDYFRHLQEPVLGWQASHLRISGSMERDFLRMVSKQLISMHAQNLAVAEVFWRDGSHILPREQLRDFLVASAKPHDQQEKPYLCYKNTHVFLLPLLFLEWTSRLRCPNLTPLPDCLLHSSITEFLSFQGNLEEINQRYLAFEDVVNKNLTYQDLVLHDPQATYINLLRDTHIEKEKVLGKLFGGLAEANVVSMPLKQVSPVPIAFDESLRNAVSAERSLTQGNSQFNKLKKLATEELRKIIVNSPKAYENIKNTFFNSLDENGKQLFYELRQQMSHDIFEDHLRRRLVDFMAKNPGAWSQNGGQKNA